MAVTADQTADPTDPTGLTDPEQRLRDAHATGALVDLRTGDEEADDPAGGHAWGPERTVGAEALVEVLTTPPKDATDSTRRRPLRLAGARITGQLDLEAAELVCPVTLTGCWFEEPVVLEQASAPAIRLPGCRLPGLRADQIVTRGSLKLSHGFTATGEVRLVGAHIGGSLVLTGAALTNPDGRALTADRLTIDQSMFCRGGFTATGEVTLRGAHIGDQLSLTDATLTNPDGTTLDLQRAWVGHLRLRPAGASDGLVDLTHAHTGLLTDDPATWPKTLVLRGFTYDALSESRPVSARQRLDWLARDPRGYAPQPYEQLAAVYRRSGQEEDARRVAIAKQRRRRASGELSWPARVWSLLLGGLVGHGYRTWYAGLWLLGWVLVGSVIFAFVHPQDVQAAKPGEAAPGFQPIIYALDVLLPVVDLGQKAEWVVAGWARWWAWASVLAGWVLTTAVVAALTGLLKRD